MGRTVTTSGPRLAARFAVARPAGGWVVCLMPLQWGSPFDAVLFTKRDQAERLADQLGARVMSVCEVVKQ